MKVQFWLHLFAVCSLMSYSESYAQQPNQNVQSLNKILVSMDTLFKPAANSEGFLIIRSQDLDVVKKQILAEVKLMQADVKGGRSLPMDSINQTSASLENVGNQDSKKVSQISQDDNSNQVYLILTGFFIVACLILAFVYYRNLKKVKESQTRLAELENEFSSYKSTMIDRERKLMRELIDARKPE